MNNPILVAFYLRSATGNLTDLCRQRKALDREFVRRKLDFTSNSIRHYIDVHFSGLGQGPEMARLVRDLKDGKIQVVMVSSRNRISRSLNGLMAFYKLAETYGFRFICEHENVDSADLRSFKLGATNEAR